MSTKPIARNTVEKIIADWRTGEYSQQKLAGKYSVSKGFVNRTVKNIDQDMTATVTAGVQFKQGLAGQDDRTVTAVNDAVHERTKHIQFFERVAVQNVQEAMKTPCENQADYRARAETILKGREAVLGKTPDTAIQINNAPAKIKTLAEFYGE